MTSRILVVEDEALIAEEIRDRLTRLQYDVVGVVDTGADAITWAGRLQPDLVLMDVHLKGPLDGIDAADEIYRRYGTPVVFLTAYSDRATVERARTAAQFGYVLKPCAERDLLVAIEMAIHRAQQEQQLRESQLSYAAILASSADATMATDAEGRVRFMNPVAERLLGWAPGAVHGQPVQQVVTLIDEATGAPAPNPVTLVLKSRAAVRVSDQHLLLVRDGPPVPIEGEASPVTDSTGRLTGVVLVWRSVVERKRAEEARIRLAALVESAADAIIGTDLHGNILIWNPAAEQLFGFSAAEVTGRPVTMVTPAELHQDVWQTLERIKQGERVEIPDTARLRKDGSLVDVWLTSAPIRDTRGTIIGVAKIVREITAERARRQQVIQDEKLRALGQLASGVAHDLNQCLGLIAGHGDLALGVLNEPDPSYTSVHDSLEMMVKSAMGGGETVRRLLTFARSREDGVPEDVELSALLDEVVKLTAPRWRDAAQQEGRPITIEIAQRGDTTIKGYPAALHEALTNLILNAVDALPNGGTIRLGARRQGDRVEVEIADTGVGMRAEVLARIFEPYFTTKGDRGTGLGLAMVFGIVERHGGRITATSSPGHGSVFHLSFPFARPSTAEPQAPASAAARGGVRILAVDDEIALADMLGRMLSLLGHTVTTARSAEEALGRLAHEPFDVLISDVGMGTGMNGWDLAEAVRRRWPDLPIILATGWGGAIDEQDAKDRGIMTILSKPYRMVDLRRVIEPIASRPKRGSAGHPSPEGAPPA